MKKELRKFPIIPKAITYILFILLLPPIFLTELTQTSNGLNIDSFFLADRYDKGLAISNPNTITLRDVTLNPLILEHWKKIACLIIVSFICLIYVYRLFIYIFFDRYYRVIKKTVITNSKPKISYKIQTAITFKTRTSKADESKLIWMRVWKNGRSTFKHKEHVKKYFDILTRRPKIIDIAITDIKKRKRKFTNPFFLRIFLIGTKSIRIPIWIIILLTLLAFVAVFLSFLEDFPYAEEVKTFWISIGVFLVFIYIITSIYMWSYIYYLRVVERQINQGAASRDLHIIQVSRANKKDINYNNLKWSDLKIRLYETNTISDSRGTVTNIGKLKLIDDKRQLVRIFEKETIKTKKVTEETIS